MLIFIIDDIIIRFEFHAMDDPSILYFTIFAAENINLVQLYFRSNFAISFSSWKVEFNI